MGLQLKELAYFTYTLVGLSVSGKLVDGTSSGNYPDKLSGTLSSHSSFFLIYVANLRLFAGESAFC